MEIKKRSHPKFRRPNYGRSCRSRIKKNWRSQRGTDNKKRRKFAYMGASPSIGYSQPSKIRDFHPRGMPEVLVQSAQDLFGLKDVLIRIASGVGRRKRQEIIKLADSAKLHVLNRTKKEKQKKRRVKKPRAQKKKEEKQKQEKGKKEEKKAGEVPKQVKAPEKKPEAQKEKKEEKPKVNEKDAPKKQEKPHEKKEQEIKYDVPQKK